MGHKKGAFSLSCVSWFLSLHFTWRMGDVTSKRGCVLIWCYIYIYICILRFRDVCCGLGFLCCAVSVCRNKGQFLWCLWSLPFTVELGRKTYLMRLPVQNALKSKPCAAYCSNQTGVGVMESTLKTSISGWAFIVISKPSYPTCFLLTSSQIQCDPFLICFRHSFLAREGICRCTCLADKWQIQAYQNKGLTAPLLTRNDHLDWVQRCFWNILFLHCLQRYQFIMDITPAGAI